MLLRACLLSAPAAVDAWEQWKQRVDFSHLDSHSKPLLALLQSNLRGLGVEAHEMEALEGIQPCHCVRNQVCFEKLSTLLEAYAQWGIEPLLLERAALLPLYYRDYGLTTLPEMGLLVRQSAAPKAERLMARDGWRLMGRMGGISALWRGSRIFEDAESTRLRVFWKDPGRSRKLHEARIWQRAQRLEIEGHAVWTRNPTDHLLEVCLGSAGTTGPAPIQWVADACMILREKGAQIDWEEVTSGAQRLDALAPLTRRFEYLRNSLGAPIPPQVIERARCSL